MSIAPSLENGLILPSQLMVDKLFAVQRETIRTIFGWLSADMAAVDSALGYVLGPALR